MCRCYFVLSNMSGYPVSLLYLSSQSPCPGASLNISYISNHRPLFCKARAAGRTSQVSRHLTYRKVIIFLFGFDFNYVLNPGVQNVYNCYSSYSIKPGSAGIGPKVQVHVWMCCISETRDAVIVTQSSATLLGVPC